MFVKFTHLQSRSDTGSHVHLVAMLFGALDSLGENLRMSVASPGELWHANCRSGYQTDNTSIWKPHPVPFLIQIYIYIIFQRCPVGLSPKRRHGSVLTAESLCGLINSSPVLSQCVGVYFGGQKGCFPMPLHWETGPDYGLYLSTSLFLSLFEFISV